MAYVYKAGFSDSTRNCMDELDLLRGRMRRTQDRITGCKFWRKIFWISFLLSLSLLYFFFWICFIALLSSLFTITVLEILQDGAKTRYKQDLGELSRGIDTRKYPTDQPDQHFQLITHILNSEQAVHLNPIPKKVRHPADKCMVCKHPLKPSARKLKCPRCHASAHKSHFLTWIKLNHSCPECGTRLFYEKFSGIRELHPSSPPDIKPQLQCQSAPPLPRKPVSLAHLHAADLEHLCCVCKLPMTPHKAEAWCPHCFARAHRSHLLEWVKIKGFCPNCSADLKLLDFITANPRRGLCYVTLK
jgi:Zn finger protein HypA/HybF involved in hydrogenase expression